MPTLAEKVYNTLTKHVETLMHNDLQYLMDATIFYIMVSLGYDTDNDEVFDVIVDCIDTNYEYIKMLEMLEEVG